MSLEVYMKKSFGFVATIMVAFGLFIYLPVSHASAQSSYDVNKSDDTAHVPVQPEKKPQKEETKTILAPTWPVQVPVRVPKDTPERPENPHAGENEGASEGLGGSK